MWEERGADATRGMFPSVTQYFSVNILEFRSGRRAQGGREHITGETGEAEGFAERLWRDI